MHPAKITWGDRPAVRQWVLLAALCTYRFSFVCVFLRCSTYLRGTRQLGRAVSTRTRARARRKHLARYSVNQSAAQELSHSFNLSGTHWKLNSSSWQRYKNLILIEEEALTDLVRQYNLLYRSFLPLKDFNSFGINVLEPR